MKRICQLTLLILSLSVCIILLVYQNSGKSQANTQMYVADQEVVQLLDILRNVQLQQKEPEKVINAILRLKEIKSPLATEELANLIAFRRQFPNEDPYGQSSRLTLFVRYPATDALVAIGEPALPLLLNIIAEKEVRTTESRNALRTLLKIINSKPLAIKYLKEAKLKMDLRSEQVEHMDSAINEVEGFINELKKAGLDSESE